MSPKIVRIVVWLATTALAIVLLAAGGPKLAGNEELKEVFIEFGWPDPIYFLTGLAEVVAGIALLVRQFRVAACALVAVIMAGAALTNIVTGSPGFVSFNLVLILTAGALAWYFANSENMTVQEALLKTGRWEPSAPTE